MILLLNLYYMEINRKIIYLKMEINKKIIYFEDACEISSLLYFNFVEVRDICLYCSKCY